MQVLLRAPLRERAAAEGEERRLGVERQARGVHLVEQGQGRAGVGRLGDEAAVAGQVEGLDQF